MPGLLFPAFQKFYSALKSLERFDKEEDFFDNISCLDTFFSEYRNITFVMQKSLAHTEYMEIYEKNRDQFLQDHWFVEKRNETIKQHPFKLIKQVEVTVYRPSSRQNITTQYFSVEDDVALSTLIDSIKALLLAVSPLEVFFSAEFHFFEEGREEDVFAKCLSGIKTMQMFMEAMYEEVGEKCSLCEGLIKRIDRCRFVTVPRDMLMTNDYAYYPQKDAFERAGRSALVLGDAMTAVRSPLAGFDRVLGEGTDYFRKFVVMHTAMQSTDLMPTIMTVYEDDTFSMDSFHSDIKTTFYRKINETARAVQEGGIREVYLMMTYIFIVMNPKLNRMTSRERQAQGRKEFLTFMKVDRELQEEEYVFEGAELKDVKYVRQQLEQGKKTQLDYGKVNMMPVVEAFRERQSRMDSSAGEFSGE